MPLKRRPIKISNVTGYTLALVAVLLSLYILIILGVTSSKFFENPILYFGSAVIQAYAALVAVPFTIWVIYMQSRYGAVIVRLFLKEVVLPFVIFAVITAISAITIALSATPYAHYAYIVEIVVSLVFLPPLISYIVRLMTTGPEEVIGAIEANIKRVEEFIALSLHILRLYILEAYPDEEAINRILRRISNAMRNVEKLRLYPEVWHRFRDLLKAIVVESTYLPNRYHMSKLMTYFMKWFIKFRKDRVARAFLRYYRLVALRYMEERLPSDIAESLFLKPTIEVLKQSNAKKGLVAYALDQCIGFLRSIERLGLRGDLTVREICKILELVQDYTQGLEPIPELAALRQVMMRMRKRFACPPKRPPSIKLETYEKSLERPKEEYKRRSLELIEDKDNIFKA